VVGCGLYREIQCYDCLVNAIQLIMSRLPGRRRGTPGTFFIFSVSEVMRKSTEVEHFRKKQKIDFTTHAVKSNKRLLSQ